MKRALKNNMKAVLETNPNEDVPVDNLNAPTQKINRRVRTQAAMIGLAISMGATSLLVTRQSDQALGAEPVGNQNTASAIPAAGEPAVKFATTNKLGIQAASNNVSVPENLDIVKPTAISQLPGLGAKWQVAASTANVPSFTNQMATEHNSASVKQATKGQRIANAIAKVQTAQPQAVQVPVSYRSVVATASPALTAITQTGSQAPSQSSDVNAQLKAQQEFAINQLQQKSNRLKQSLAQLRPVETNKLPQVGASSPGYSQSYGNASKLSLVSKPNTMVNPAVPDSTPQAIVPTTTAQSSASIAYEVKPGDTLAAIALRNGTSVSEIIKANSLVNPNGLKISQKLTIPSAEVPVNGTLAPIVTASGATVASNVVVPTPAQFAVASNSPVKSATVATPELVASGMGGDSPVPTVFTEIQTNRDNALDKQSKSSGLDSLKAEIERLREKYRAQQSGQIVPTTVNPTTSAAVSIPVYRQNTVAIPSVPAIPQRYNVAIPVPTYRPDNAAVPIPVPSYSAQPINPDFAANQSGRNWNNSPNAGNTAITVPSGNINTAQFGNLARGTAVSPQLPPLAAVDRYLPRAIDENTPPLSTPTYPGNPRNSGHPSISTAYIWPAKGVLTSGFGMRWGRPHRGLDVANATGTPIYASADGVIEKAGWNNGGYGNVVDIRHPDGSMTRYGHNSKILVQTGQPVHQGQTIALMGSTGFSTGPHSHFEIHPAGKGAVNPIAFLPARI